jgi:hypothetical protein
MAATPLAVASGCRQQPTDRSVRLGSNASFRLCADNFRSAPMSRHFQRPSACLKGAISGSGRNESAAAGLLKYAAANVA